MLLVDLVNYLINYHLIKDLTTELKKRRKELLQVYNGSSILPAVKVVEKLNALTPYCIELLRAQAAMVSSFEISKAVSDEIDGDGELVQESIWVVAPMGEGARAIAEAFSFAYEPCRRAVKGQDNAIGLELSDFAVAWRTSSDADKFNARRDQTFASAVFTSAAPSMTLSRDDRLLLMTSEARTVIAACAGDEGLTAELRFALKGIFDKAEPCVRSGVPAGGGARQATAARGRGVQQQAAARDQQAARCNAVCPSVAAPGWQPRHMDDQHDRVWASRRQPRPLRELEPAQLRLNSRPPCKLFTVAVNNLLGDIKTALRCLRERGCLSAEHAAEATELAGALAAMARPDVLVLSASEVAVCSLTALMNSDKMTPGLVTHPLDVGSLVAGEFALQTLSRARVVGKGATQARVVIGAARQRYTPRATRGALASGSLLSDAWCAAAGFGSVPRRSRFKSLGLRSALAKPPAAVVKAILDDLGLIDDASLPGLLQTHALVFRGVRSSESVMQARSDGVSVGGGSVIVGGAALFA
ncbi:hypothetical protein T492DRAFT_1142645 [Pavlovales sp. CCMP2436]|nr:hypothetical protein T492DRAFT_1142645 [Pavlovales sp. CCMP2436]